MLFCTFKIPSVPFGDSFLHVFLLFLRTTGFLLGGLSGFGVTGGAHRFWTHRSYKANTPLRIILMLCFTLSGQNSIYEWVRDHRVHHKFSETDADPHNSYVIKFY